ncbi:tRNA 4-thiouridine(8) synthase ThiI [Candidatus Woesearchaeota archaeon]|nr:tRNA 4-thiouridine(8) synthase ThiI [Candidatus Woesearchaeota archaeon]
MYNHAIIHYAEIALKGENRIFFEQRLVNNIKQALKNQEYNNIERQYGRIVIELNKKSNLDKIKEILKDIPGIEYFSFALYSEPDIESMKDALLKLAKNLSKTTTFRITAKKSTTRINLTSMQINEKLGELIVKKFGSKVKLKDPGLEFIIEITDKGAFHYTEKLKGIGGLPVGVSGKLISLISGGIDSPVAAFSMFKRGCRIVFVHFHNNTANKNSVRDKVEKLVKTLTKYQFASKLYLVPFENLQKHIIAAIPAKYRMIIYRRFMLRIAEQILKKEKAKGFITGDSLAQVASQTLENLNAIYEATSKPIFAPLIGFDKQEIINLAERIGTYNTSILPYGDCCSFLVAKHPETKAKIDEIKELEKSFETEKLVSEALSKAEVKLVKHI